MDTTIKNDNILDNRYRIVNKIADGGMSEVFLAYDLYLNRDVAIKIILKELSNNQSAINRFRKEYNAISRLKNPNILQVYGYFVHQNRQCIVLELVRGYTLKEQLLKLGPCSIPELIYYFKAINAAITEAHDNGIIHRDIKPENVLVAFDGSIKVGDFGVAIMENSFKHNSDEKLVGTAKYMAPEVIKQVSISRASDIYSLGVILYELLIGTAPFVARIPSLIAVKHIRELPIAPSKIRKDVSPLLEFVILKSLSKNPNDRYQNVKDFANDLNKAFIDCINPRSLPLNDKFYIKNNKRVLRKSGPDRYRFVPWFLSRKLIIIVIAIIIVLIIVLLIGALFF